MSWTYCTKQRFIRLREHWKANGNARISELGILGALAADCSNGSSLFEIGTFDGRTTLNFALNAPAECTIYTLDLPPDMDTLFSLADEERHLVDKPAPGSRYEANRRTCPGAVGRIYQLLGDSATFDYSPYAHRCSLVFVDGSHSYEYVISDSRAAMRLVAQGGVILWHDYGIWGDVTRAIEDLDQREGYGLANIRGTSLVYWQNA